MRNNNGGGECALREVWEGPKGNGCLHIAPGVVENGGSLYEGRSNEGHTELLVWWGGRWERK